MKSYWKKNMSRTFAMILSCIIMASGMLHVYATDTVDSLEDSTSELEGELSGLNADLETVKQDIDNAASQIEQINTHIAEVRESLALAKGKEESQYEAMKLRMVYIYESGNMNFLAMLLTSDSMADFLNRAEYVSMISEYDRKALQELAKTQETIAAQEAELQHEQKALAKLQADLYEKETVLNEQIADTSGELAEYTEKLAKAKEEAQQAEEQAQQPVTPVAPPEPTTPDRGDIELDYSTTDQDIIEFAALLECEAGTSHEEGILAVASVVVNRMNHPSYPDSLHGVMYQSGQFPPVYGSYFASILSRGVNSTCLRIAKEALAGANNVGDCLSFRSASSGYSGTVIGGNVFF